jgi:hypothetical protein
VAARLVPECGGTCGSLDESSTIVAAVIADGLSFPRMWVVLPWRLRSVSHIVGRTLGSQAYRIGDGGAFGVISIPIGMILPSWSVRQFLCVGLKARSGTLCLSDKRV